MDYVNQLNQIINGEMSIQDYKDNLLKNESAFFEVTTPGPKDYITDSMEGIYYTSRDFMRKKAITINVC